MLAPWTTSVLPSRSVPPAIDGWMPLCVPA
jgi:hypothetical protein